MRLMTLLETSKLAILCSLLTACGLGMPKRPDAYIFQAIVSDENGTEFYGYNVLRDYDESGTLKSSAKPYIIPVGDKYAPLRGWYLTDKNGFKEIKRYSLEMKKWVENHCK